MKVIIAGKNNIAIDVTLWLIKNVENIEIFAICNATDNGCDSFQRSFLKFCNESSISLITLDEAYSLDSELFLSLEFDKIVNPDRFKHENIINIHFSCLPKYKGMYTSAWPILNGDIDSGVTLHCINSGIDTGAIIDQTKFTLDDDETAKSLYLKYIQYGTALVIKNLPSLMDRTYIRTEQSAKGSTYYSRQSIQYKNLRIDLNQTAENILRQIRAYTFRDYQLPRVHGYDIYLGEISNRASSGRPGQLLDDAEDKIVISTIDYDLELFKDRFDLILNMSKNNSSHELSNYITANKILFEKNTLGWSPIIVAAYHGNIDLIRWLVSMGCDINDHNNKGTTVAMYYKDYMNKTDDYSVFDELISLGADLDLRDFSGLTVFDYVKKQNNEKLLGFMMECKKND